MATERAIVSNKIAAAYEHLVMRLEAAGEDANCGGVTYSIHPRNAFKPGARSTQVLFHCCLHLRQWRWRASSHSTDRVNILVKVEETINREQNTIERSSVRVNYFAIDGETATMLECIQFDYIWPPLKDHPVFHAQFDDNPIPAEEAGRAGFTFTIDANEKLRCFKFARVPTCDMTLCSVLLMLVADHCGGNFFESFLADILPIQNKLPRPLFDDLKTSLGATTPHFKSSHWFSHMKPH